jgi:hypothetical protein
LQFLASDSLVKSNPGLVGVDVSDLPEQAHDLLMSVNDRVNGMLYILYWQDTVKKVFESTCVVGVYYTEDEAKAAAKFIEEDLGQRHRAYIAGIDPEDEGEDEGGIWYHKLKVDKKLNWKIDWGHRIRYANGDYGRVSWLYVIQEIDNPLGNGPVRMDMGYHCGRHKR